MANNELITGWTYTRGELAHQKLDNWNIGIAAIAALIISSVAAWPLINWDPSAKGKISGWVFVVAFFIIAVIIYYLLKIFSGSVFFLYKKLFGVKEEEIIFTSNKITSTNKTWILNDETRQLKEVKLNSSNKTTELCFKGVENKVGKSPVNYTVNIPVPGEFIPEAEKVKQYFTF